MHFNKLKAYPICNTCVVGQKAVVLLTEKVSELCARLFADLGRESMEQAGNEASSHPESVSEAGQVETDKPVENEPRPVKRSSWSLVQCEEFTQDYREYKRRCRKALLEALMGYRASEGVRRVGGKAVVERFGLRPGVVAIVGDADI